MLFYHYPILGRQRTQEETVSTNKWLKAAEKYRIKQEDISAEKIARALTNFLNNAEGMAALALLAASKQQLFLARKFDARKSDVTVEYYLTGDGLVARGLCGGSVDSTEAAAKAANIAEIVHQNHDTANKFLEGIRKQLNKIAAAAFNDV